MADDTFNRIVLEIDASESDQERHLSIQLDEAVRAAVRAVRASNKKATITMKLTIAPDKGSRVTFGGQVDSRLPRPGTNQVTLYTDAEGNVHRADPAQMPIRYETKRPAPAGKE